MGGKLYFDEGSRHEERNNIISGPHFSYMDWKISFLANRIWGVPSFSTFIKETFTNRMGRELLVLFNPVQEAGCRHVIPFGKDYNDFLLQTSVIPSSNVYIPRGTH